MKFGFRTSNLNKRIASRTSLKRYVQQDLGFKALRDEPNKDYNLGEDELSIAAES